VKHGRRNGVAPVQDNPARGTETMAIIKTVLIVTILHDSEANTSAMSLADIGAEMDSGEFVGSIETVSETEIPQEKLAEELEAVGSDESVFGFSEDE
jgi:hypothetical protein